jgi:hypothetical protein
MLPIRLLLNLRSFLARSWWLSWCLYRLHRLPLVGPPGEWVWYFAYGANMHEERLSWMAWHATARLSARPSARLPPALQS